MKPTRTWILIADSGRAHVLENLGPGKGVRRVEGLDRVADLPRTHDIVDDRQGRSFESSSATRHALTPPSDPRERLKRDFLASVATEISERLAAGAFDRLIVVAPPHALGTLRQAIPDKLRAAVAGEVAKDLTKTPDREIASHLEDVIVL
jgi:protein required for attachment to host cells